ncbi:MAG: glycosyltransferase [Christensenellales bacterium]
MINILFCGNEKVFDGILTCSLSILKRTSTNEPFTFYVYTMDVHHLKPDYTPITDEQINFLNCVAKSYNGNNKFVKVDVTEIYNKQFANSPNEQCYCSPYTLLRLFADIVPNMPDKLLYLDVDIMLNRDICLLYDTDVTNYEFASSRDHYGKYFINPNYINAGVLLFNIAKCRQTKLFEKARELIKTKKLPFADQSALYRSTTKKLMLPQRFNDQKFLHKHTVIRHFSKRMFWLPYPHTENIKQWHVTKVHIKFKYTQFDDIFEEYIYLKNYFKKNFKEINNEK